MGIPPEAGVAAHAGHLRNPPVAQSSPPLPAPTAPQGQRQHSGRSALFRRQHRPLLGLDGSGRQHRLAVLVPYRDRLTHLTNLLPALRSHLNHQNISYDVFILEQVQPGDACSVACFPRATGMEF